MKEKTVQAASAVSPDGRSIVTERLILRPFEEGDCDIMHRLYGDAEVMQYTPFDPESPRQSQVHLARIIEDWEKTPVLSREYVIAVKSDETGAAEDAAEKKIGRCHILCETAPAESGLCEEAGTAKPGERAMIGWMLVQEAWGKGYATETAHALIVYGFDVLGLREVYGLCHPDNTASRRAMEKCGMTLREWRKNYVEYKKNGRRFLQDELEYVLTRPSSSAVLK